MLRDLAQAGAQSETGPSTFDSAKPQPLTMCEPPIQKPHITQDY
jgi:hypothetical protein